VHLAISLVDRYVARNGALVARGRLGVADASSRVLFVPCERTVRRVAMAALLVSSKLLHPYFYDPPSIVRALERGCATGCDDTHAEARAICAVEVELCAALDYDLYDETVAGALGRASVEPRACGSGEVGGVADAWCMLSLFVPHARRDAAACARACAALSQGTWPQDEVEADYARELCKLDLEPPSCIRDEFRRMFPRYRLRNRKRSRVE
jgi:hypothetical protein